jgi:hypothetical protein
VLGAATALQHRRPDRVDEVVCGGVSGLAMAVGIWQVSEISWCPAELLMLMRAFSPFDTQRS